MYKKLIIYQFVLQYSKYEIYLNLEFNLLKWNLIKNMNCKLISLLQLKM